MVGSSGLVERLRRQLQDEAVVLFLDGFWVSCFGSSRSEIKLKKDVDRLVWLCIMVGLSRADSTLR